VNDGREFEFPQTYVDDLLCKGYMTIRVPINGYYYD